MIRATGRSPFLCVIAGPAMAQNLLVNPGFDATDQLSGWTCTTTNGVATWSPDDRLDSPTSGSIQHDVTATADNRHVRCSQCVPVNEQFGYLASTWFFWPDDSDVSQQGSTRISIVFYTNARSARSTRVAATSRSNPRSSKPGSTSRPKKWWHPSVPWQPTFTSLPGKTTRTSPFERGWMTSTSARPRYSVTASSPATPRLGRAQSRSRLSIS